MFDLFHIGHLNVLKRAANACDHLIVGVTTDDFCQQSKGHKPFIEFEERLEIVANLRVVDQAVSQSSLDKYAAWKAHRFDVMFVGDDWKGTDRWNKIEAEFAADNVSIVYFPYTKMTSSTILRKALRSISEKGTAP